MTNGTDGKEPAADAPEPRGLACPACQCRHFFVIYTRSMRKGRIMRRRECRHCGRRITTWEKTVG